MVNLEMFIEVRKEERGREGRERGGEEQKWLKAGNWESEVSLSLCSSHQQRNLGQVT